jgi:transmembrane sensor
VDLTPQERHINLDRGEAYFEVTHDPNRPFIVQVGRKRIIAVGTKFSVRRNDDNVRVLVTEGKVRVETLPILPRATHDDKPGEVFVTPGSIASAGDDGIVVENKGLSTVEDDLTWRQGYLTFHDKPLAEVIAEFNRYNAHKLTIDDPQVAAVRISGTFRAVNYEAFVRVLNDGFSIHAIDSEDTTTLTK